MSIAEVCLPLQPGGTTATYGTQSFFGFASAAIGADLGFLSEGNPPIAGEDFMQRELSPRQREARPHTANWSPRHRGLDSLPESGGFEKDKRGGQSHRPKQDRFDYQDRFN
jgi:hypothetical protein